MLIRRRISVMVVTLLLRRTTSDTFIASIKKLKFVVRRVTSAEAICVQARAYDRVALAYNGGSADTDTNFPVTPAILKSLGQKVRNKV